MNINASLWHQELLRAASDEELLSTVHDYLVLWRPDELAQLPVPCQPARLRASRDISDYTAALLGHEAESPRGVARESLTAFFTVAARRAAELTAARTSASVGETTPV